MWDLDLRGNYLMGSIPSELEKVQSERSYLIDTAFCNNRNKRCLRQQAVGYAAGNFDFYEAYRPQEENLQAYGVIYIENVQVGHQNYTATLESESLRSMTRFKLKRVVEIVGYDRPVELATYNLNHLQQVKIPKVYYNGEIFRVILQYEPEEDIFVLVEVETLGDS
jgi:hypothetical protein